MSESTVIDSSRALEDLAGELEACLAAMEAALQGDDWSSLAALGERMKACLAAAGLDRPPPRTATAAAQHRLIEVARRHEAILEALREARDRTAAELDLALQGHRGASQYLAAAGGS